MNIKIKNVITAFRFNSAKVHTFFETTKSINIF